MSLLWVVILSCGIQLTAAVMALRLMSITKTRLAWGLLSSALFLMAFRRAISFYHIVFLSNGLTMDPLQEYIGLVLSTCMLLTIIFIKPLFFEIKKSETEAQENKLKFQIFSDYTYDWEYWRNPDGSFVHISPSCERYTGYTAEEFYNQPELLVDIVHPDNREDFRHHLDSLELEGRHSSDFRIITKNGEERWIAHACQPIFDDKGNSLGRRGSNRDITLRKQLESELKLERDSLRSYFDLVGVMIIALDHNGNVTKINKFGGRLLGYPEEEIVGKNWFDNFVPATERAAVKKMFQEVMAGNLEGVGAFDNPIVTKDGQQRMISWRNTYVTGQNGEIVQTLSSGLDITKRQKEEAELEKHRDRLEEMVKQRTAELEAFTYSVSHDLRAPLRSIDGFSQVVIEDYSADLDKKALDYLRKVRLATERMALMIDDLLLLSRATQAEVAKSKVDVTELAEEAVQSLRQNDPARKAEIKIQKRMTVWTDPVLIRIVLDNLLSNSWKFTSVRKVTKIELGWSQAENEVLFQVHDNGVGFDARYADKLFTPFQRLHSQDEFPGTGIGLATVARVIHRLGGRVWAEAETGKGATFGFSVPRNEKMQVS